MQWSIVMLHTGQWLALLYTLSRPQSTLAQSLVANAEDLELGDAIITNSRMIF